VRITAATCIHEGFLQQDHDEDTSSLREALTELLVDECPEVMQALIPNLDKTIEHFAN
jgi:hypothetical protein